MKQKSENAVMDYIFVFIGTLLMAVALNVFFDPNNIVIGGATGIAVIVKHLSQRYLGFAFPLGITNFVINIPLFTISIKVFGLKKIRKSFLATVLLSLNLIFTQFLPVFEGDLVLVTVFGGALTGMGLALIFRSGATTGGSDMAASLLQRYFKHYTVANIMFVLDVVIIVGGYFVFGSVATMYAVITVFIVTKVIDAFLEGLSFAKAAFIISDYFDEISKAVIDELDRGVTSLYGRGMFSRSDKNVLLCVVSRKEVLRLKEIAKSIDENAFIMVADVREVLGEGFRRNDSFA